MKPFLKWAGGKRWLTYRLKNLNSLGFTRYVEPFIGSGALFFHTEPERALLGDRNAWLIDAYKALKKDWASVLALLKKHQKRHSTDYYYMIRAQYFPDLSQRAAQLIYLNRTCWNGLYRENKQGHFNVPKGTKTSVLLPDDNFKRTAEILSTATLWCCDFEKIIENTGLGDLIFVDPPYTVKHNKNGFLQYNENIFSYDDQIRLAKAIYRAAKRGAKVIGTNAYHKSIADLYEDFASIIPLSRHSVLSGLTEYRVDTQEALILIGLELKDIIIEDRARIYDPYPKKKNTLMLTEH